MDFDHRCYIVQFIIALFNKIIIPTNATQGVISNSNQKHYEDEDVGCYNFLLSKKNWVLVTICFVEFSSTCLICKELHHSNWGGHTRISGATIMSGYFSATLVLLEN